MKGGGEERNKRKPMVDRAQVDKGASERSRANPQTLQLRVPWAFTAIYSNPQSTKTWAKKHWAAGFKCALTSANQRDTSFTQHLKRKEEKTRPRVSCQNLHTSTSSMGPHLQRPHQLGKGFKGKLLSSYNVENVIRLRWHFHTQIEVPSCPFEAPHTQPDSEIKASRLFQQVLGTSLDQVRICHQILLMAV